MLVLSRRKCEQIQIGDRITITIVRIKGHAVQVGIDAPRDVRIVRGELAVDDPPSPAARGPAQATPRARA